MGPAPGAERRSRPEAVQAMAEAALAFLDATGPAPHPAAAQPFEDEEARRDWEYRPRNRPGLALAAMTSSVQKAAYDLLATGLSLPAFAAATTIIALEDVLDEWEGRKGPRPDRPAPWGRHRADYAVTVFGRPEPRWSGRSQPGAGQPWGWRFEGHHLSVNVTVVGEEVAATPLFMGANPAEVLAPTGQPVTRPLAAEEEVALALVEALPAAQRSLAVVDASAPPDILTSSDPLLVELPERSGLAIGAMSGRAASLARSLLDLYLDRQPRALAARRRDLLAPQVDRVHFVFAGQPAHRRPHYYRLQGPSLLVEYDNAQDGANHVHTVVRDRDGDFGDDLLRAHRAAAHPRRSQPDR